MVGTRICEFEATLAPPRLESKCLKSVQLLSRYNENMEAARTLYLVFGFVAIPCEILELGERNSVWKQILRMGTNCVWLQFRKYKHGYSAKLYVRKT
jgi:hypothetical protein